jgi:PPP family 3-phenylpropionic acid transporter
MSSDLNAAARVGALYWATFFGIGIHLPFFPIWLAGVGMSADQIAALLATPSFVRMVASTWTAGLADRHVSPVRMLVVANLLVATVYLLMMSGPPFWAMLALMVAFATAQSPIVPVSDMVAIEVARSRPRLHYGRLRAWGSIAFIVATLAGGQLVGSVAVSIVPPALALSYLAAALVSMLVPAVAAHPQAQTAAAPRVRLPSALVATLAAISFLQASYAMVFAFGSLSFAEQGFSPGEIGALWASGVVVEIVVFLVAGRAVGPRFPAFLFLAIGGVTAAARWVGMGLGPPPWLLALLMAAHGISFAFQHLGTIGVLAQHAPQAIRARCQGLAVSAQALATGLTTAACGPLYQAFGVRSFLFMAPLALVGFGLTLLAWRLAQPQSDGAGGKTTLPS